MDQTPRVLKNKGIEIVLAGKKVPLALTCSAIADIEIEFESIQAWQEQLATRPASAARKTLALVLTRDEAELGPEMDAPLVDYVAAIGIAWGVANGLDPTKAVEALAEARKGSGVVIEAMLNEAQKMTESLGTLGSGPGANSGEASESSGD